MSVSSSDFMKFPLTILFLIISLLASEAVPRTIAVFVALCDNDSQKIAPVPARIGDGNKTAVNLYWGCSDGFASFFERRNKWKLIKTEEEVSPDILVRQQFKHASADLLLTASAYRGSAIETCTKDFEEALAQGNDALVAYLGHNGLMDAPTKASIRRPAAVVLCCKSKSYFQDRIEAAGGPAILLTDQFIYPCSFLLHDALEAWRQGQSPASIRSAASRAYARNQNISVRTASAVFSNLGPQQK
jgi:hypothetical protein